MEKEFVPYELAVKLKALNYPQNEYFNWYDGKGNLQYNHEYDEYDFSENCCSALTFSQAFRWFREKHELFCWIEKFHVDETYIFQIPPANFTKIQGHYITYEEAELACLTKLIEIVESKSE